MRRYDDPYRRGYPMGPEWGRPHPQDPNWADGEYHGMRMQRQPGHGAYGFHRQMRENDLQGYGGFDGIYDEGPGEYDRQGVYHHPYFRGELHHGRSAEVTRAGYDAVYRHVENGGVHHDTRYLRQYNSESPALRGRGGYDRSYGNAPRGGRDGELTRPDLRGGRTDERGYAGYNRGGFAPGPGAQGLDPRK